MKGLKKVIWIILKVSIYIMAVASVLPVVLLMTGALCGESELYDMLAPCVENGNGYATWHFIPLYPTLKNLVEVAFDVPEYYVLFWNSMKIVAFIILGQFIFAVPAAWGLARCKRVWSKVVFFLYMFCMILPFQVTMLSEYIVLNKLHMIDTHWSLIVPMLFSTFPIFIMYSSFEKIPESVIEAAKLDGASEIVIYVNMAIPIAREGIVSAGILGFLEYWNMVEQPVVFIENKELWPLAVYLPMMEKGNMGSSLAMALLSCLPSLLVFYLGKGILVEGISIGSTED